MKDFKHLSIGIVGGGRVGASLGRALQNAGYTIGGVSGRSVESRARIKKLLPKVPVLDALEIARTADILILAVPDDSLRSLILEMNDNNVFRPGQFVLHTAGSKGLEVFEGTDTDVRRIAFHPAMTFTGARYDVRRLVGATYGVTVEDESGRRLETQLAKALVAALNGTIVVLNSEQRVLYHAALTHSSNYFVTLIDQAFEMLEAANVQNGEEILEPLLQAALGNALFKRGEALSGPVSRGDVKVVKAHRKALSDTLPDLLPAYDVMGEATVEVAKRTGRLTDEQAQDLKQAFGQEAVGGA